MEAVSKQGDGRATAVFLQPEVRSYWKFLPAEKAALRLPFLYECGVRENC
jgi:hypothetical protein